MLLDASTAAVLLALAAPTSANDLFLDRAALPADATDLRRGAAPLPVGAANDTGPTCLADLAEGEEFHGDTFNDPKIVPEWYDPARVARGNAVFEKRGTPILLSWTLALVVGLSYEPMIDVLVFTNESDTVAKVIERYGRTGAFLSTWCSGDPMNPNSSAFKATQEVRTYHEAIRKQIEPVLPPVAGEREWMTQYDMSVVQTAFLSAFAKTQTFGFTFTEEEMGDFIYLWRVVGYQLGLDDRFNAATMGVSAMQQIIDDVYRQIIIPALSDPPTEYGHMAGVFVEAMNLMCLGFPCFTVPSVVGLSIVGFGDPMPVALSTADRLRVDIQITAIRLLAKLPLVERLLGAYLVGFFNAIEPYIPTPLGSGSPARFAGSACPALARRAPDLQAAHQHACKSLPAGHDMPEWCSTPTPLADNDATDSGFPMKMKLLIMAPAASALALATASAAGLAFKAYALLA